MIVPLDLQRHQSCVILILDEARDIEHPLRVLYSFGFIGFFPLKSMCVE